MKDKYILWFGIIVGLIGAPILWNINQDATSATITRGVTFASTDLVTNTKLHQLVDNATISGISASDLSDGLVSNAKLAANSVTTDKILDGTIQGLDISNRSLTASLIATNQITGTELFTNIVFNSGTLLFTNANTTVSFSNSTTTVNFWSNQVSSLAVSGVTNTTGAAMAGKVVKLNDSGVFDSSFTPFTGSFTSTNLAITAAGSLTQAHGLGTTPSLIQCRLKCTSSELNYSVNDEVIIAEGAMTTSSHEGVTVVPDATNLNIRYGSAAQTFALLDKTTGNVTSINDTKWVLIIRAWK